MARKKTNTRDALIKAAEKGDASAQNDLAIAYYEGDGVEQDLEKTVFWMQKAAEQESN